MLLGRDFPTAWLSAPDCHPHELDKHSSSVQRQIWEALTPCSNSSTVKFWASNRTKTKQRKIGAYTSLGPQLPGGTRTSQSLETFLAPRKNWTHLIDKPPTDPLSPSDNFLAKGYKQVLVRCSQACEESFQPEARRPFSAHSNALLFSWEGWRHNLDTSSSQWCFLPQLQVLPPCFLWPSRSREEPGIHINSKHPLTDTHGPSWFYWFYFIHDSWKASK